MKNTIIALAMTASLVFVGGPAQADDVPPAPVGDPVVTDCNQAFEDAYSTYNELQWQIELTQRAQRKIELKNAEIKSLRKEIRQLKHRLNR